MMKSGTLLGILFILSSLATVKVASFAPVSTNQSLSSAYAFASSSSPHYQYVLRGAIFSTLNDNEVSIEEWTPLTDDGGVKMREISSTDNAAPDTFKGKDVTVEYIGSIARRDWSVDDINTCWLPEQGLTPLAPKLFKGFDINGEKLMNAKKFNKKFILQGLGVLKEAKVESLFQAAQDLKRSEQTHPAGTVFDKNQFTFRLGKGMSIKAFDLAIREMRVGQTVSLVARCDYAYGERGLRGDGKFLIPPYATVQFDLTFLEIK